MNVRKYFGWFAIVLGLAHLFRVIYFQAAGMEHVSMIYYFSIPILFVAGALQLWRAKAKAPN
ncbi:MAG: hypothetical protein M3407_12115 [Acidobacteriota bacterium]|nr:hypothetical protein [Acidobacteriota bacterium]